MAPTLLLCASKDMVAPWPKNVFSATWALQHAVSPKIWMVPWSLLNCLSSLWSFRQTYFPLTPTYYEAWQMPWSPTVSKTSLDKPPKALGLSLPLIPWITEPCGSLGSIGVGAEIEGLLLYRRPSQGFYWQFIWHLATFFSITKIGYSTNLGATAKNHSQMKIVEKLSPRGSSRFICSLGEPNSPCTIVHSGNPCTWS